MSELYLIAHKVRGEPAFDVAIQMHCPHCRDTDGTDTMFGIDCHECDSLGYWWIIPTSGHRAFPSTFMHLDCVTPAHVEMMKHSNIDSIRDHYLSKREATKSLVDMLGLKPKKLPPIVRRL